MKSIFTTLLLISSFVALASITAGGVSNPTSITAGGISNPASIKSGSISK